MRLDRIPIKVTATAAAIKLNGARWVSPVDREIQREREREREREKGHVGDLSSHDHIAGEASRDSKENEHVDRGCSFRVLVQFS